MIINTPLGSFKIPSSLIGDDEFAIKIMQNSWEAGALETGGDGTVVLGGGAGATITASGAAMNDLSGVSASIPVPESVDMSDITAVILTAANGSWTPVTWKMDMVGNVAYVDIANLSEGTVTFVGCEASFRDVPDGFWAKSDINTAAAKRFILGVGDNRFDATSDVTRAGFTTILLRVGGYMTMDTNVALPDVSQDNWSYAPLAIGKDMGLITGYQDGSIHGDDAVTRGQAMTMVGRFLRLTGCFEPLSETETSQYLSAFSDAGTLPDWAEQDTALCVKCGIILGSDGKLNFTSNLTRAQCAAIANRLDLALTQTLLP
jgi:hypothetical protein